MLRAPRFAFAVVATLALSAALVPVSTARADEAAVAPSVDDISAKVQAFYNQTKTFQAQFNQVYKVKLHQRTKKSSGRVTFEKPGKMHWQYDENGNHVVSDGKSLKVYEKDNNQMFEQPVEKSQYPAALSFLMGQGDLSKSFTLKQLDSATMKFEGGYVLEGIPKEATPAYQKVLFYIDRETAQVRRVIILDAQGNRNEFTFKSPSVNKDLPKDVFDFTPPTGTQIVHPE
jgi:outer membrane lipoprotein carrier protein